MGIAEILAFLAFGIALIALWLGSDLLKKVEMQNERFAQTHVRPLRDDIKELNSRLQKMAKVVALNEAQLKDIEADRGATKTTFEAQLKAIESEISALDQSIPQQYRTSSAATAKPIQ